jgi:hypothetical protein
LDKLGRSHFDPSQRILNPTGSIDSTFQRGRKRLLRSSETGETDIAFHSKAPDLFPQIHGLLLLLFLHRKGSFPAQLKDPLY